MDDTELRVELARMDERLKALTQEILRSEKSSKEALELARSELAHRLHVLNDAHQEARRVHATTVSREMYDRDLKEMMAKIQSLDERMSGLQGKLWLPMLIVAAAAAALAAGIARIALH